MKMRYVIGLTAFAAAIAAVTPHARSQNPGAGTGSEVGQASGDGSMLSTMPQGNYQCALPGDATGAAYDVIKDAGFRLGAASSYSSEQGGGVYLLKGRVLTFTRGAKKGERYRRIGTNQLQKLDAKGRLTKVLCTRTGAQRFSRD